ncbi:hypothetical protein [Agaribacter marinus]|uniref:Uncharacterized protein n=1 Tax=Agaribacter marinus TaxID=1431249 RepID=A0AA37WL89_9ALTE|nr:hypothetical protein [Agaribacter marinus]GLR71735.1 hypothetical protein GCM10007852_26430 [Agaribacter marinus]
MACPTTKPFPLESLSKPRKGFIENTTFLTKVPLKRKLTESQIVVILKLAEFGKKVNDICRELGISSDKPGIDALNGIIADPSRSCWDFGESIV